MIKTSFFQETRFFDRYSLLGLLGSPAGEHVDRDPFAFNLKRKSGGFVDAKCNFAVAADEKSDASGGFSFDFPYGFAGLDRKQREPSLAFQVVRRSDRDFDTVEGHADLSVCVHMVADALSFFVGEGKDGLVFAYVQGYVKCFRVSDAKGHFRTGGLIRKQLLHAGLGGARTKDGQRANGEKQKASFFHG